MNQAGTPSSNKTGLVLKISLVLFILLATVVYKLNDYFKNEKMQAVEAQLRDKVMLVKTSVSSQLTQLKNTLSSYETELNEANINWVQLEPFFAIARVNNTGNTLQVNELLVRSNTPAERWNKSYFENALTINQSGHDSLILVQLFQDKADNKFLIIRFKLTQGKELVVAGFADYFQKFFDIERGEDGKSLLVTFENILAAHSESDYIAASTTEANYSVSKYLHEKEEISGTNLIAVNYVLKNKISQGFDVPWSILGIVVGFGFIFIAILFYSIDPIERKIEFYKRQERAQIYKDTLNDLTNKELSLNLKDNNGENLNTSLNRESDIDSELNLKANALSSASTSTSALATSLIEQNKHLEVIEKSDAFEKPPKDFYSFNQVEKSVTMPTKIEPAKEESLRVNQQNLILGEQDLDLVEIEKALALDEVDEITEAFDSNSEILKRNLSPQKIGISHAGLPIVGPQFSMMKKKFMVDEAITNIRRPEKRNEKKKDQL